MEADVTDRIRERAYQLWEADGYEHGRDQEYWLRAERQIISEQLPDQQERQDNKDFTEGRRGIREVREHLVPTGETVKGKSDKERNVSRTVMRTIKSLNITPASSTKTRQRKT